MSINIFVDIAKKKKLLQDTMSKGVVFSAPSFIVWMHYGAIYHSRFMQAKSYGKAFGLKL